MITFAKEIRIFLDSAYSQARTKMGQCKYLQNGEFSLRIAWRWLEFQDTSGINF